MEKIRCVVERVTYHNEDNGYTVIKVRVKNYRDLVTVVGSTASVNVGTVLLLDGTWKFDSKYGRQFAAEKWEELLPATVIGIEKYLGSGLIKGIGPKYARKITAEFGEETLEVIEKDPDRLMAIPGIGSRRIEMIKKGWQEQKEVKNIMIFLQQHDVSTTHAAKIYKTYGDKSIETVTENPYKLADDIWGIGFKTADTIAAKLGFGHEKYIRLRSGIIYTLNKLSEDGHCFATREQLIEKAAELLEADSGFIEHTLDEMVRVEELIKDEDAIYLPAFYFSEAGTARKIMELTSVTKNIEIGEIDSKLQKIEKANRITYDDIQIEAIKCAVRSKVMVLTGGPGTGKTTTTLGIINIYKELGYRVILAAPTGRASKRMSEATGMEAKTIHRLLEYKPPEGYQINEEKPLEGDVLILDECSMIDIILMYNLLKAVPKDMTVIFVGDIDQLPSVGAGNVLRDIIESGAVTVVKLERIFRQAMDSRIITNAHRINKGMNIEMRSGSSSDFFFIEESTPEKASELIVDLCSRRLPKHYKIDPVRDIQVLTPMQRGEVGAVNLNLVLQSTLNKNEIKLRRGGINILV